MHQEPQAGPLLALLSLSPSEIDYVRCILYADEAAHYREARAALYQIPDLDFPDIWALLPAAQQQRIREMCKS